MTNIKYSEKKTYNKTFVMEKHFSFRYGRKLFLLISVFLTALLDAASQNQTVKSEVRNYPPVPVPNTEMRTINSTVLNQEMNLYILLPSSYYSNPQKVYQALYFTDANRSFPMVQTLKVFLM